jgi:adenosine deaminase
VDLTALPKVHLHVHLESAVRWDTLREIAGANDMPMPPQRTMNTQPFTDFRDFGDHGSQVRECLRTAQDFMRIAEEFCEDEAAQGIRYSELTFTAASHGERLGDLEMPLEAVLEGLRRGMANSGLQVRVLLDQSRRQSVERAWRTLRLAQKYESAGVVGIGMAGDDSYSLSPFVDVINAAADSGVHLVHHAGESAGPESITEAITIGRAERIGHGVTAIEDPLLVAQLIERNIAIEACPSSNVALGMVATFADHPLHRLRNAGVPVTLNVDIPAIIHTSLVDEYANVRGVFGYGKAEIAELARAGVIASFAPNSLKMALHKDLDAWLALPDETVPDESGSPR